MGEGSRSSSDDSDGDAGKRAAVVDSVLAAVSDSFCAPPVKERSVRGVKTLRQIEARKLLDKMLEEELEFVRFENVAPVAARDDGGGGGVRLLRNAPPPRMCDEGDAIHRMKTRSRRIIVPRKEELHERSKKFRKQVESAVVEGSAVVAAAATAANLSLFRVEASKARSEAAARREEERVAHLKKLRGERWLPSMQQQQRTNDKGP